jgi:hypothetical protein
VTTIPPLPTVVCPVCRQKVGTGLSGTMIGWHWRDPAPGRRRRCSGEGTPVVDGRPMPADRGEVDG